MATKKHTQPPGTDGPVQCEHCGGDFPTPRSRASHYRFCKERPGYQPPPKKKRTYTQSEKTQRQRQTAALKHGQRSDRAFADTPCSAKHCQDPGGHPCTFLESAQAQGGEPATCWPDAVGISADRGADLKATAAVIKKAFTDPSALDDIVAHGLAVKLDVFERAGKDIRENGLVHEVDVPSGEDKDGKILIQKRTLNPAAPLIPVLGKSLGFDAREQRLTRKSRKGEGFGDNRSSYFDTAKKGMKLLRGDA